MGGAVPKGYNNSDLVDNLVTGEYIVSPAVERAFRSVDRACYFLPAQRRNAYQDSAWRSGVHHLSAPCIYAKAMEKLEIRPGMSFLNIGSGTGYLSTVIGLNLGSTGVNHGVEIHQANVDYAIAGLSKFMKLAASFDQFDFCVPVFVRGDGLRIVGGNRYDRIYCGAGCDPAQSQLIRRLLKEDGIAVLPLDDQLVQIKKMEGDEYTNECILSVSFSMLQTTEEQSVDLPDIQLPSLHGLCRTVIRAAIRSRLDKKYPYPDFTRKKKDASSCECGGDHSNDSDEDVNVEDVSEDESEDEFDTTDSSSLFRESGESDFRVGDIDSDEYAPEDEIAASDDDYNDDDDDDSNDDDDASPPGHESRLRAEHPSRNSRNQLPASPSIPTPPSPSAGPSQSRSHCGIRPLPRRYRPYRYEPTRSARTSDSDDNSSESNSESDNEIPAVRSKSTTQSKRQRELSRCSPGIREISHSEGSVDMTDRTRTPTNCATSSTTTQRSADQKDDAAGAICDSGNLLSKGDASAGAGSVEENSDRAPSVLGGGEPSGHSDVLMSTPRSDSSGPCNKKKRIDSHEPRITNSNSSGEEHSGTSGAQGQSSGVLGQSSGILGQSSGNVYHVQGLLSESGSYATTALQSTVDTPPANSASTTDFSKPVNSTGLRGGETGSTVGEGCPNPRDEMKSCTGVEQSHGDGCSNVSPMPRENIEAVRPPSTEQDHTIDGSALNLPTGASLHSPPSDRSRVRRMSQRAQHNVRSDEAGRSAPTSRRSSDSGDAVPLSPSSSDGNDGSIGDPIDPLLQLRAHMREIIAPNGRPLVFSGLLRHFRQNGSDESESDDEDDGDRLEQGLERGLGAILDSAHAERRRPQGSQGSPANERMELAKESDRRQREYHDEYAGAMRQSVVSMGLPSRITKYLLYSREEVDIDVKWSCDNGNNENAD